MPDKQAAAAELEQYASLVMNASGEELAVDESFAESFVFAAIEWADRGRDDKPHAKQMGAAVNVYKALAQGTRAVVDAESFDALEAIILPGIRPVGDVLDGKFTLPKAGEFIELTSNDTFRRNIESALRSVGCVVLPGHPSLPYGGTGFVVGDDLVMTNRHVAQIFCSGLGTRGLSMTSQFKAGIDPLRERDGDSKDVFDVKEVVMIHPYWDVALLRVPGLKDMPKLKLAPLDVATRRRVALVGYPAFDARNPADVQVDVFNGRFNVKRVAPGYLAQTGQVQSFENVVDAGLHDASTLGGASGSAVVDVATGNVVGIHFAGRYKKTNYAVPMAELARDQRLIDLGLNFTETRPDKDLPWDRVWRSLEQESVKVSTFTGSARTETSLATATTSQGGGPAPSAEPSAGTTTLRVTVPLEITVTVGRPTGSSG